ncbi:MAG: carboxypeptidase regulatory-like domain-containing protein [Acidobacteriota bacterium]
MNQADRSSVKLYFLSPVFAALLFAFAGSASAQTAAVLQGQVMDDTGAGISAARLTLATADGKQHSTIAAADGEFRLLNLSPGQYTLTVEANGFQSYTSAGVKLPQAEPMKITLTVASVSIVTEVKADDAAGASVEPDQNLSQLVLDEQTVMDTLPDNEDDLREYLDALAGPAAGGASGGQSGTRIYVDGFPGGRLPPKEAIMQIRINQNPFSAEYAHPGVGRTEILTKPGSESWHGGFNLGYGNSALDARNAFAPARPDLDQLRYAFTLSGPLVKKKMSFFLNGEQRRVESGVIINAKTLTGDYILNAPAENENRFYGGRIGYTINDRNTLSIGYNYSQSQRISSGGGFVLPDRGSINDGVNHTVTLAATSIVNSRLVHEARLRFQNEGNAATARTPGAAINVLDAFQGGGSTCCPNDLRQRQVNFQDYLTFTHNKHTLRGTFQLDYERAHNISASNFNGTYTFSSLDQYRRVLAGERVDPLDPASQLALPAQFTINRGNPLVRYSQIEASWFVQDDYRIRQNLTLSFGLRQEIQNHLPDSFNLGPRFSVAWSPAKYRKTTIRTGGGIFFNRLTTNLYETTRRFDGVTQQSVIIRNPQWPDPFAGSPAIEVRNTVKRVLDPAMQAPYTINFTSSLEHQFRKSIAVSATHVYTRGVHFFRSRNINAPLPVTGIKPDPAQGNIYQLESSANSTSNSFLFRADRRLSHSFSLFGNYALSWTSSDADTPLALPADSYNLRPEWGRALTDRRHSFFVGGTINLPWAFRLSPFVQAISGAPFNITTGQDDNRDAIINDRPAGNQRNSDLAAEVYSSLTNRCLTNCQPGATPVMLIEFLRTNFPNGVRAIGPNQLYTNLSITKTFGFGKRPVAAPRKNAAASAKKSGAELSRFNVQISAQITNLLNRVNFGQYSGVLTSPFFGRSNYASPARHVEFNVRLGF